MQKQSFMEHLDRYWLLKLFLWVGKGAAGTSGAAPFLLHITAHVGFVLAVLQRLLLFRALLAVVLDKVHQAVHHSFHCDQALLQLLPCWRGSIWAQKNNVRVQSSTCYVVHEYSTCLDLVWGGKLNRFFFFWTGAQVLRQLGVIHRSYYLPFPVYDVITVEYHPMAKYFFPQNSAHLRFPFLLTDSAIQLHIWTLSHATWLIRFQAETCHPARNLVYSLSAPHLCWCFWSSSCYENLASLFILRNAVFTRLSDAPSARDVDSSKQGETFP